MATLLTRTRTAAEALWLQQHQQERQLRQTTTTTKPGNRAHVTTTT